MLKLCFSTLGCVEKGLDEVISLARNHGIEALEIRGLGGNISTSDIKEFYTESATNTKNELSKSALLPLVLGTSCMFHTEEKYAKAMVEGKESIDIAERIGFPFIRVFGNNITEDKECCIARVCGGISELCSYAADKNVCVLLEVHGDFNTSEALLPIIDSLKDTKNFGLIWDVAHTHRVYRKEWREFYEAMKPYIRHVHIKDVRDSDDSLCQVGEGNIPISDIVTALIDDGYDGYFSLEWEKKWHPELGCIEDALKNFTDIIRG